METNSKLITTNCKICNKEIVVYKKKFERGRGQYCSTKCQYDAKRSPRIKINCEKCGKEFETREYILNQGRGKYCSKLCGNRAIAENISKEHGKDIECFTCGKLFHASNFQIGIGFGKYCSNKCFGISMRGKDYDPEGRYSPESNLWRKSIYKLSGNRCEMCGAKSRMNAHHILQWKDYKEYRFDMDNGMCLCDSCHKNIHFNPPKFINDYKYMNFYLGYLIDNTQKVNQYE